MPHCIFQNLMYYTGHDVYKCKMYFKLWLLSETTADLVLLNFPRYSSRQSDAMFLFIVSGLYLSCLGWQSGRGGQMMFWRPKIQSNFIIIILG